MEFKKNHYILFYLVIAILCDGWPFYSFAPNITPPCGLDL